MTIKSEITAQLASGSKIKATTLRQVLSDMVDAADAVGAASSAQTAAQAYTDTNAVRVIAANNNIVGGTGAGAALTTSTSNILVGLNAGHNLAGGTGENVCVGASAGLAMTTGTQNTIVGAEAGSTLTGDTGHTLVGYQAGLLLNGNTLTWNTFVGHSAGKQMTDGGSNVGIGRAALNADQHGGFNTAVGHAAMLLGTNNVGVCAYGDVAGGADCATGSANWQGSGLTYFGAIADVSCSYFGRETGKSTVDGRNNSHAIGTLARIPKRDNVMVLGHGLAAVETAARIWDGWNRTDITSTIGMTITIGNMNAGMIVRAGTLAGAVNDTTDTAANIVASGPGPNCEVPCSMEFSFSNQTTGGFTTTLVGGTGVSVSGLGGGGAVASAATAKFRIVVTTSTIGSEACTLYRVG